MGLMPRPVVEQAGAPPVTLVQELVLAPNAQFCT